MITLQNGTYCFVGTTEGELGFTNNGTWTLPHALYVVHGTNEPVDVSWVRDGAAIVVDSAGQVTVTEGPEILMSGIYGFWLAFYVVGTILFARWAFSFTAGAAGIPHSGAD